MHGFIGFKQFPQGACCPGDKQSFSWGIVQSTLVWHSPRPNMPPPLDDELFDEDEPFPDELLELTSPEDEPFPDELLELISPEDEPFPDELLEDAMFPDELLALLAPALPPEPPDPPTLL